MAETLHHNEVVYASKVQSPERHQFDSISFIFGCQMRVQEFHVGCSDILKNEQGVGAVKEVALLLMCTLYIEDRKVGTIYLTEEHSDV